jgi:hypothetical protein
MENEGQVTLDHDEAELPPAMEYFLSQLKEDRKKLLKDKAFTDPAQLRGFIGQYLFPRLIELVQMLGGASWETYSIAVSNTNQLQRLHSWTVEEMRRLGSDVEHGDSLPGVSMEVMDDFHQSFYALGSMFKKKLPDDKEMEEAFNLCARYLSDMTEELMGRDYEPRGEEGEERGDPDLADPPVPPGEESSPVEELDTEESREDSQDPAEQEPSDD